MSISQSHLSQAPYNYDMVVAVTQKALNNVISTYYSDVATKNPFTQQTCYYTKVNGNSQLASLSDMPKDPATGNNIDPLSSTLTPAQISTLKTSNFFFAFSFTPGDPKYTNKYNFLEINPGSDSITYYLLCTTLSVAYWNPDQPNPGWVSVTQTIKTRQPNPVGFNINANISLKNIINNTNLPAAVQAEVNNLGNTGLDVQQLIFDFDSAVVNQTTSVTGIDNNCSVFTPLMQAFTTQYFAAYSDRWVPVLNYSLTQKNTSSLIPTAMDMYAGAEVDSSGNVIKAPLTAEEQDLATLNYLFSVNGEAVPAPRQFNWNWLDIYKPGIDSDGDNNADVNKYRGAICINRNAFANYVISSLNSYVAQNCWAAYVSSGDGENPPELCFTLGTPPATPFQPYNPNYIAAGEPDQLCVYFYDKIFTLPIPQGFDSDYMTVQCYFSLMVDVNDAYTLTLTQNFKVQIDEYLTDPENPNGGLQHYSGAPVYKTYADVFKVVVNTQGGIAFQNDPAASSAVDKSTDIDSPYDYYEWDDTNYYVQQLAAKSFTQIPFTFPSQFVFPGGDAFTYQNAQFNQYSDLVCNITYQSEQ